MHKIYIASTLENKHVLRPMTYMLTNRGHEVTADWIWNDTEHSDTYEAERDLRDIDRSNILVFWPDEKRQRSSGKFVELGYALRADNIKTIYVVERESSNCVFLALDRPKVVYVKNWTELLDRLEE